MSKYTSKKCRCVNRGEIMLFQLLSEQTILKKMTLLLGYLFIYLFTGLKKYKFLVK